MTQHRQPKVSVAIPVYNGAAFLADAIDCVLRQSLSDLELIICDDQSSDASFDIAASFRDSRIRLMRNARNLGFGGNWNRCLAAARGQYIKILPQDDLLAPDCFSRQAHVLDQDEAQAIALVSCARWIIDPDGRRLLRRGHRLPPSFTRTELARRIARMGTNPLGEPGAVLFRHSAARAAGSFDGSRPFVIDIDYWLRLLEFGNAAHMREAMASFRISPNSHSVRMLDLQHVEFAAFLGTLSQSGNYGLSPVDHMLGRAMATVNRIGRAIIYRPAARRRR